MDAHVGVLLVSALLVAGCKHDDPGPNAAREVAAAVPEVVAAAPDSAPSDGEVPEEREPVKPDVEPPRGRSMVSFDDLSAGRGIGFEALTLDPFVDVETKMFFGEQEADSQVFADAFVERLDRALAEQQWDEVRLFNGAGSRATLAFVYHSDRTVRGLELTGEPKLEAWLVALAESFDGEDTEYTIRRDGVSGGRFTKWDELLETPSSVAVSGAPDSYRTEQHEAEKEEYFSFSAPEPSDVLFSKERFEAALSSFLQARGVEATSADADPLDTLQEQLGAPLPGDFRALYAATGGMPKAFFGFDLLSAQQVLEERASWKAIYDEWTLDDLQSQQRAEAGIYPVYISPRWVPFIDLVGGNYLAIDLGPRSGAPYGQVIVAGRDVDGKRRVADGVTELLEKAATYDGSKGHPLYSVFGELRM